MKHFQYLGIQAFTGVSRSSLYIAPLYRESYRITCTLTIHTQSLSRDERRRRHVDSVQKQIQTLRWLKFISTSRLTKFNFVNTY
jgi:hypothetical protein